MQVPWKKNKPKFQQLNNLNIKVCELTSFIEILPEYNNSKFYEEQKNLVIYKKYDCLTTNLQNVSDGSKMYAHLCRTCLKNLFEPIWSWKPYEKIISTITSYDIIHESR